MPQGQRLIHGDMLSSTDAMSAIAAADVIFTNNFLFTTPGPRDAPSLNGRLALVLSQHMKPSCCVVSTAMLPADGLQTDETFLFSSKSFSWSPAAGVEGFITSKCI